MDDCNGTPLGSRIAHAMTRRLARNILVIGFLALRTVPVVGDEAGPPAAGGTGSPEKVQQTMDRGLAFLIEDAVQWRKERGCATCHHGIMTVWALSEARSRGYVVP